MSVSNQWLDPFQRSYNQIKSTLIERLKVQVPELTDFSEGNIFILLISLFAAIAEVLHYYIDNMARETFFVTARRYSSLVKHAKMVDYHIHAAIPSMVDVLISNSDNSPATSDLTIPLNTVFTDNNGNQWLSTKTVVWKNDTYGVYVPLEQKQLVSNVNLGLVPGSNFIIQLGDTGSDTYYVEGSMSLKIGEDTWELVTTFGYSGPYDKHYKVELDDNRKPYIMFGDGVHGALPRSGLSITASYYITKGSNGFVQSGAITSVPSVISSVLSKAVCLNTYDSVSGSNYETFDQIKTRVPLSIRTLGVAITQQDYEDIVKSTPGVDKAYVNYICGKYLEIYITPFGGGVAPSSLINKAYLNILNKKVITTRINVLPVNTSEINLTADITGKKSFTTSDISNQVVKALLDNYGYNTSDIGKPVRLSDLYALIDNLSTVDYLSINKLFIKPYPKKVGTTLTELNVSSFDVTNISTNSQYVIRYTGSNNFELSNSNGNFTTTLTLNSPKTIDDKSVNNKFSISFGNPKAGSYTTGNSWIIQVLPANQDQVSQQIILPIFTRSSIHLNITETV